jgi:hypothetical protein
MSLDVYLTLGTSPCPNCDGKGLIDIEVYWSNITHNLSSMAKAADVEQACWDPEKIGITKASQLAPFLQAGLEKLKANPATFKIYEDSNGWGTYENLVEWLEAYLKACLSHPDADVRVSR